MIRDIATRFINAVFVSVAAVFAGAMLVCLVCAVYAWTFTDDSLARHIGRAVGCLVFALLFKFLSRLDEFEFVPATTTTTTTRRGGTRRPTRKA